MRDQPCVRLTSGGFNTSDGAGATILLFTAGEGDKHSLTKGRGSECERAGLPPLPSGQQPHLQVQHLQMKARTKGCVLISHCTGVHDSLK